MKKHLIAFLLFTCSALTMFGQTTKTTTTRSQFSVQLNEYTVVRDSSGIRLPYPQVLKQMASGDFTLDPIRDKSGNVAEYRIRRTRSEDSGKREVVMRTPGTENFPKPKPGDTLPYFHLLAMDSSDISSADLKGKIVVINFWFSLCKPCLYEMPAINNMAAAFKNNPDVVFLAPDFEKREVIARFMKLQAFAYTPIPEASALTDAMKIRVYPTHLILGRNGEVLHSYAGGLPGIEDVISKDIIAALKN